MLENIFTAFSDVQKDILISTCVGDNTFHYNWETSSEYIDQNFGSDKVYYPYLDTALAYVENTLDRRLKAQPTAYAIANGCYAFQGNESHSQGDFAIGNGEWWLREYGRYEFDGAGIIGCTGAYDGGRDVFNCNVGVRPAIRVTVQ